MKINVREELEKKNIKTNKSVTGASVAISTFLEANKDAISEVKVKFEDLEISPANMFGCTQAEINELAASISSVGLLERLIVEKGSDKYEILSGQKRFKAIEQLHDEAPEIYKKWFPDNKITCTLIDLNEAYFIGESEDNLMTIDAKRRYIISSANIQHEKTVRDYMLQYKAKKDFYQEQKEKGLVKVGTKHRDFMGETLQIASRSAQMIITAEKTIEPELWSKLETFGKLESIKQLDAIAKLSKESRAVLLNLINDDVDFSLEKFLKNPTEDFMQESEKSITEAQKLTSKEIEKMIGLDQLHKSLSEIEGRREIKGRDIEQLMKIKEKLLKQKDDLDKLLRKYK